MRRRPQPEAPSPEARARDNAVELSGLVAAREDVRQHPLLAELRRLKPEWAETLANGHSVYRDPFGPPDTP